MKWNRSLRLSPAGVMAAAALLVASACGVPGTESDEGGVQKSAGVQAPADVQKTADMGLGADHALRARNTLVDELGTTHVRYDHLYRGVRVWGGDTIVHSDAAGSTTTGRAMADIRISTHAALSAQDALAVAHRDLQPRGPYARQPAAELVIYPQVREVVSAKPMRGPGGELNAIDIEQVIDGYTLAYYVHTELENGAEETRHTDYLVDASSGSILEKWDALQTAAATGTGTGYSEYSGTVSLGTNSITGGFEMRDLSRGMSFATYNLNHGITATIYTDADNFWGDGADYIPGGSTTNANGQTAAVDAHYGMARTYDYYYNVHGRNGFDGAGTASCNRVHYSTGFAGAFWSDSSHCMTYGDGDGSYIRVPTALDVAGHEMSHGVTSHTAGLIYSGESGGLNESMSDIGGTMVEFYARGGSGSTIGDVGGNWTIGEQVASAPFRYMYKPSKDGISPDAWYSGIGSIDVHYSSGPMNRAFYFLSQGASSTAGSDYYSSYLPGGMTGIGNDHAARVQYRALAVYMTPSTNYAGARAAFLNAAAALYGSASADYAAVENAFAAINVGTPHVTALRNGIPIGPLSGNAGDQRFYKISVPAGQAGLTIQISAMTGDADLYVRYGALPTTSSYDCRPYYGSGAAETCTFNNPAAGDWYIMVRGWSAYSNLYLTGTYWANLADGIPVGPLSGASYGDQLDYKITVPAGRTSLIVQISGGTGDADLYVKYGGLATLSAFDCRPYIGGNKEACTFTNPAAGDWYIMVNAYSPYSGVMLVADYSP